MSYLGNGGTFDFYCVEGARLRGAVPAADLRFSALCKVNVTGSLSLHHFFSKEAWTRHLGLKLDVANVFDGQQRVRAADGTVPYRYQPDLLDPVRSDDHVVAAQAVLNVGDRTSLSRRSRCSAAPLVRQRRDAHQIVAARRQRLHDRHKVRGLLFDKGVTDARLFCGCEHRGPRDDVLLTDDPGREVGVP